MKIIKMLIPLILIFSVSCTHLPSPEKNNISKNQPINQLSVYNDPDKGSPTRYTPLNFEKVVGMWFSYIDLNPMLKDKQYFSGQIEQAFENAKSIGVNTVYVHVRSFGDSLYKSSLFPTSKALTADYDPLEIMINIAHQKGLAIHAWINPLRLETPENMPKQGTLANWYNNYSGKYICSAENDEHLWLNPAYSEVINYICAGVKEIVSNYQVDGIHIDDYFYPTQNEGFDKSAFDEFSKTNNISLDEFRRQNINNLVSGLYSAVKSINNAVEFGVSPQGNIQNNYDKMYADVKLWCNSKGYADYILPQIYYGYQNPIKPFETAVKEFAEIKSSGQKLICGLAAYKLLPEENTEEEFQNTENILAKQTQTALESGFDGVAIYSYNSLFGNENQKTEAETSALGKIISENIN